VGKAVAKTSPVDILAGLGVIKGLSLPATTTRDQFEALCVGLGMIYQASPFLIGDALVEGQKLFGDDVFQLADAMNLTNDQKAQYMRVSECVPEARRYDLSVLSWSHHRAVAPLDANDQKRWLAKAHKEGMSKTDLERAIRAELGPATVGRGATAEPEQQVVEAAPPLEDAAREVYLSAEYHEGTASVPAPVMEDLGRALNQ